MPRIHHTHQLFDTLIAEQALKNDAALCVALGLKPSMLSKVRHGVNPVSADMMIRIHEKYGMPIARIKSLAGMA